MTADTKLPPYLPYPRFLMEADLTQFSKLLYSVLLDRANLSLANGWQDDEGQIYIVFPVCKIANAVDRSPMTVKNALTELETVGLIERRRQGFSLPNRIYVKIPDGQDIVLLTDKKLSHRGKETCPTDGQKAVPMTDRKLSPNNLSNNNLRNSTVGNKENSDRSGDPGVGGSSGSSTDAEAAGRSPAACLSSEFTCRRSPSGPFPPPEP